MRRFEHSLVQTIVYLSVARANHNLNQRSRSCHWKTNHRFRRSHPLNTLRPRQDGCLFPDDIFKSIFFNENVQILIRTSLTFVPKAPINNIPALDQIMAWRRQATSHYLNQWWLVYWRIYASLGLNDLTRTIIANRTWRYLPIRWALWSSCPYLLQTRF